MEKEGGGIGVFEFPFGRSEYGPRRLRKRPPRRPHQTVTDRPVTKLENEALAKFAERIPASYRGWALKNSDDPEGYELSVTDVEKQETIEPPRLRRNYDIFMRDRTPWTTNHDLALAEMNRNLQVRTYIEKIEEVVNLTEKVLPREELWNVLREPIAGELIIPRKTRGGHRVHVNPFVFQAGSRQIRISSNFITFGGCIAEDLQIGLDKLTAVRLIAAFLVSSFGQLQFEMEGYNREGLLALEKAHLGRIRIFDPRWIRTQSRQAILDAFANLPYPVLTDRLSVSQTRRNILDTLFANEISAKLTEFDPQSLENEVHAALDEWLIARQP